MDFVESLRVSGRALGANKLRSALTMLGIIIGVAAVITLLSVGNGVQDYVTTQLNSAGSNLLFVVPGQIDPTRRGRATTSRSTLTNEDVKALSDSFNVPAAKAVAPEAATNANVQAGKRQIRTQVSGVTPDYLFVRNVSMDLGNFISAGDVAARSRVIILGAKVPGRLFDPDVYPIGQTIKINRVPFRVIGVFQGKGGTAFGSQDDNVFVPISTAQARLFPGYRNPQGQALVSYINIQVVNAERMDAATHQITDLLRQRHNISYRDDDDFSVINQQDLVSIFGQITGVLTVFLGAIAGISLLVGGIGIMNIMLVSVTERTREIGLRKAVGAKRRDILIQFLLEAIILAMLGGIIGIGLGYAGSSAISAYSQQITAIVTPQSIALAVGFSAAVGLFFGIYPATRAARLSPIEALRYE